MIRCVLLLLVALGAGAARLSAGPVELIRLWPEYREAASFETLGELLGQGETTRGRLVARTQPAVRDGFYFLVRLRAAEALTGAQAEIAVVLPGSEKPVLHKFKIDLPMGRPVLHLGLTGADWPAPATRPIAWRLTLRDAQGAVVVQSSSFLWGQS